jgi:16S rRNA (guanine966-N2)-methyltransferase
MRIIAGLAKGCVLRSLRGRELRPTMDRVREALFAVLAKRLPGARFLDLYAGAGTVGLEALSRGAAEAVFVESHRPAGRVIRENAARCGLPGARVMVAPVPRALAQLRRQAERFDVIFADPPYDRNEARAVMARLGQWPKLLNDGGVLVLQRSRHEEVGEQVGAFRRMRQGRFGETILDYFQVGGDEE